MGRVPINPNVQRRLYAESMGKCMNPNCLKDLFDSNGDIIEKAHIDPYCKTADNTFENLVVLCPNCHTNFDKNKAFTPEEVLHWKEIRKQDIKRFFSKHYSSFNELKKNVKPLLMANKTIYEKYYLGGNKQLWDKFEINILINNRKIKETIENNLNLFQTNKNPEYSNLSVIHTFLQHIQEYEITRQNDEIIRTILFPAEINSIFDIEPVSESIFPSTESLEALITELNNEGSFESVVLDDDTPRININRENETDIVYLSDTPKLRQMYYDYKCFRKSEVRLNSLVYALRRIRNLGLDYEFPIYNNLRVIRTKNDKIYFVYKYCLSEAEMRELCPDEGSIVVNLHNWNGDKCISKAAYDIAKEMNVKLFIVNDLFEYVRSIKHKG